MGMLVYEDGNAIGSINVVQLEEIQKLIKATGKRKLAAVTWPVESVEQLTDALAGGDDDDEAEPVKASASKSKPNADMGEALSDVDLPALLDKTTKKKGTS